MKLKIKFINIAGSRGSLYSKYKVLKKMFKNAQGSRGSLYNKYKVWQNLFSYAHTIKDVEEVEFEWGMIYNFILYL